MSDENDGQNGSIAGGEENAEKSGEENAEKTGEENAEKSDEAGGDEGTGDEGTDGDTGGSTSPGSSEPSGPQQLLDAVGEQIDEVRRRVDDQDTSQPEEETFIEEGEGDEDQPVDDTIAPPG